MRRAGILLHVSSLPGPGPIGNMGEAARRFVDFMAESGQRVWQVLPLTPPADANSPYSAYSVFAGNPYFIDLFPLEQRGALPKGTVASLSSGPVGRVDYQACEDQIIPLLLRAFTTEFESLEQEISHFRAEHAFWLEDYALYMAIRTKQGDISYHDWPALLCVRETRELERNRRMLGRMVDFWVYIQYLFFTQWMELKAYANGKGISILGDMPIYTASGSADVWSKSEVFLVNQRRRPAYVAGVPPDAFSADGQRWGNPLYNWPYLKQTGYQWWIERLRVASLLYDEIRIDHFRGLDEFYAIPAREQTAQNGIWEKGPGMDFFNAVREALPGLKLIAEDLGTQTGGVRKLLEESGLPGMAVLLFAFDPSGSSQYLPRKVGENTVAYIGTHDNDTALGWLYSAPGGETDFAVRHLHLCAKEGFHWGMVRSLYRMRSETAIVQMQDFLGLDNAARMNTPATVGGGNWSWRMEESAMTPQLSQRAAGLVRRYGRG